MVRYQNFRLKITNVLVAEFRDGIRPAIPLIIALFGRNLWHVDNVVVDALSKLSEHCKVSNFVTGTSLIYL